MSTGGDAKAALMAAMTGEEPVLVAHQEGGRVLNVGYSGCAMRDLLWLVAELTVWLIRDHAKDDPVGTFDEFAAKIRQRIVDPKEGMDS